MRARATAFFIAVTVAITMGVATTSLAETTQSPAAAPPPACSTPEYRQFDFWAGDWDVTTTQGKAGENRIEKILGGCALLENWTGAGGGRGKSLNFYDASRKQWHQTWIDASGKPLALDGKFENGRMVLIGKGVNPADNTPITHRITWNPLPGGKVRQLWESSPDGKTWTVQFDGTYAPRN